MYKRQVSDIYIRTELFAAANIHGALRKCLSTTIYPRRHHTSFFFLGTRERERETSFLSRMQNGRGVDDVKCRAPEDGSLRGYSLGPDTHRVPHGTRAQVLTFVSVRLGMRPICGLSHDWATERRSAAGFVVAPTFSRCSSRSSRTS